MRLLAILVLSVLVFGSCVTNKKYQLMQKNDVNKQNMPTDSVFRKYSIEPFDYKIQTNDILSVRFESLTPKEYDFLSTNTSQPIGNGIIGGSLLIGDIVDENGEIPFPVVGKVKVGGKTVFETQDYLQEIANKYLESPIVKVRLLNYRITILGEVNKESVIVLNNNRVTMLEAIGQAGGLTDLSDKTSIKLIRQTGGKTEVVYLNILDEDFIKSPYYYVYQNDVLIVPALKQRPFRKYFGQNLSLFISSLSLLLLVINYTK
ncbi:MAG: polysaccharide biosynthesis/export family protein [Flammeovirgaceae bacterium]|jgi:polysaccharide export outer membrane protein|nr:polysaccharide biosynthesis/export family protein [Flammeovirgaceae bacterium]